MVQSDSQKRQSQQKHWNRDKGSRRRPDHPVVLAAFERFANTVSQLVSDASKCSVLDVGCGNGYLQWSLEKRFARVVGLDFSQEMLRVNPCADKVLGSATNLPFEDNSFDLAVASHLLHHLPVADRIEALLDMKRVATRAVVSFEPNRNNPLMLAFCLLRREERMALEFTTGYMKRLFTCADLEPSSIAVLNWVAPNKSPGWWLPVARLLDASLLRRFGFDICTIAALPEQEGKAVIQG